MKQNNRVIIFLVLYRLCICYLWSSVVYGHLLFMDPIRCRHIDFISVIRMDFSVEFTEFSEIKKYILISQHFSVIGSQYTNGASVFITDVLIKILRQKPPMQKKKNLDGKNSRLKTYHVKSDRRTRTLRNKKQLLFFRMFRRVRMLDIFFHLKCFPIILWKTYFHQNRSTKIFLLQIC